MVHSQLDIRSDPRLGDLADPACCQQFVRITRFVCCNLLVLIYFTSSHCFRLTTVDRISQTTVTRHLLPAFGFQGFVWVPCNASSQYTASAAASAAAVGKVCR